MTDPMLSTLVVLIAIVGAVWMTQQNWRPTPLFASGDWGARFGFGGKRRQESAESERRPDSDILDEVAGGHYGGGRAVPPAHAGVSDESDPFDQIFGERDGETSSAKSTAPSIWSLPADVGAQSVPPPPPPPAEAGADTASYPAAAGKVILPPPPPPPAPHLSMDAQTSDRNDPSNDYGPPTNESSINAVAAPWPSDMGLLEAIANMATSGDAQATATGTGNVGTENLDDWTTPAYHGTPSVPELPLTAPPAVPFGDLAPMDPSTSTDWASPAPVDPSDTADWAQSSPVETPAPVIPSAEVDADADSWHSWQWANLSTDNAIDAPIEPDTDANEWDFETTESTSADAWASEISGHVPLDASTFDLPEVETAFGDAPVHTRLSQNAVPPVRDAAALQSAASDFFEVLKPTPPAPTLVDEPIAIAAPVVQYPVTEMWLPEAVLDTEADIDSENWDEPVPEWDNDAWPEPAARETTLDVGTEAETKSTLDVWAEPDTDLYSLFGSDDDEADTDDVDDVDDVDDPDVWAADYGDQVELVDEIESVRLIEPVRAELQTSYELAETVAEAATIHDAPLVGLAHRSDPDETRVPVAPVAAVGDKWASTLLDRLRSVVEAPAEAPDALADFEERFERGLSFRLTDDQVFDYLGRGLNMIVPDAEAQILRADEIDELAEAGRAGQQTRPGCGVSRGDLCPAVVQQRTLQFDNSEHLDACPHLANRGAGPFSASCIPLRGSDETNSGVLHITTLVNGRLHDETVAAIEKAAVQTTDRLNQLRAHVRH